jgi:hypothetical protein
MEDNDATVPDNQRMPLEILFFKTQEQNLVNLELGKDPF